MACLNNSVWIGSKSEVCRVRQTFGSKNAGCKVKKWWKSMTMVLTHLLSLFECADQTTRCSAHRSKENVRKRFVVARYCEIIFRVKSGRLKLPIVMFPLTNNRDISSDDYLFSSSQMDPGYTKLDPPALKERACWEDHSLGSLILWFSCRPLLSTLPICLGSIPTFGSYMFSASIKASKYQHLNHHVAYFWLVPTVITNHISQQLN